MRHAKISMLASCLIMASLSSCGSNTGDLMSSPNNVVTSDTTSAGSPSETSANATTAPPVAEPLDASKFINNKNICKILNVKQLNSLELPNARAGFQKTNELASQCSYSIPDKGLGVAFLTANKNGLSDIYAQKPEATYWQTLEVSGHPAAIMFKGEDRRKSGTCLVNVGVTDSLVFFAEANGLPDPTGKVACERAKAAAAQVITTLQTRPNPN